MVEEEGHDRDKSYKRLWRKRQACQIHLAQRRERQDICNFNVNVVTLQLWINKDKIWVTSDPIRRLKVSPASPARARGCENDVGSQSLMWPLTVVLPPEQKKRKAADVFIKVRDWNASNRVYVASCIFSCWGAGHLKLKILRWHYSPN